jgi:uncharacterized damage-inducible protein DinB
MTTEYFKRLFEYDFWANERMLAAMEATPELAEEAVKKMSHLLMAKALWLSRLMPNIQVHPMDVMMPADQRKQVNGELKKRLEDHLAPLTPEKLAGKIAYKNTKGIPSEFVLSDILAHLANHGTYHRGQVATLIKKSGGTPPETDFIVFVSQEKARIA